MFSFATMPDMKPATGCWIKAPAGRSAMPVATITQFLIFQLRETVPAGEDLKSAKHWLFYTLLRLRLPLKTRLDDPEHGLAFDFVADSPRPTGPRVLTGHDNGLITIAIEEADDAERERRRTHMGERLPVAPRPLPTRGGTLFRDVLIRNGDLLEECRVLFGDDRQDYGSALQNHYANGPPAEWQEHYVSAYATTHPWED